MEGIGGVGCRHCQVRSEGEGRRKEERGGDGANI